MGSKRGHTMDMARKLDSEADQKHADQKHVEDSRCGARNAFHAVAVVALLDHAPWSFGVKEPVGYHKIVDAWGEEIKRERETTAEAEDQAPTGKIRVTLQMPRRWPALWWRRRTLRAAFLKRT